MTTLLFHKPYGVLSQFTPEPGSRWGCLADHIPVPDVYAAGRLDADSEGLLLLTSDGRLQQRLTDPAWGHWRRYWVQVEGRPSAEALTALRQGLVIQGQRTLPARAESLADPQLPERDPPIRWRAQIPTSWLQIDLREGRNRQVRRMTAAVGLPTLRLLRVAIDLMDGGPPLSLNALPAGHWRAVNEGEQARLDALMRSRRGGGAHSPGRGGRAGGGKSGRAGGGG
ncbi:MAG: pseudouridine synthase [Vulcanococcus sp.]